MSGQNSRQQKSGQQNEFQFEELADLFAKEIRSGLAPDISDYAARYPSQATAIHRLFPVLEIMEQRGTPATDFSESGLLEAELANLQTASPRQLGDYRIIREIGRGGMGVVFEAEQESLGRHVALKLLPESAQFDARRKQRFLQEAQASAKLQHPNIVNVFGIGAHESTSYFVMQYIEGQPLNSVLQEISRARSKGLDSTENLVNADIGTIVSEIQNSSAISNATKVSDTPAKSGDHKADEEAIDEGSVHPSGFSSELSSEQTDVAQSGSLSSSTVTTSKPYWMSIGRLGVQVASALEHAHANRILHRDIKPSNLMIDQTGDAWVTDFGLAKFFESTDLTRTGEVVGTLRYMSPEQLNGNADERSDIFGLGLTLYEMAALKPAYPASDRSELMKQVLDANPARLRSIDRQIPRDLETIIHKCIASEPRQRYQCAAELTGDLQRFLNGEPVQARQVNFLERSVKWCRRRPVVAALCGALAVSLVGGFAGVTWQWRQTENALTDARENLADAKTQTLRADKHFRQARESVDKFYTTISEQRLLREPGLQPLRRELMQEALVYYRNFAEDYADDESLRLETGKSMLRLVEIESQLGIDAGSLESCDESISIFASVAEDDPDNEDAFIMLGKAYSLKSRVLRRRDLVKSLELTHESIDALKNAVERFPDSAEAKLMLAVQYQMLGLTYESLDRTTGRTDRSLENYNEAYLLRKELQLRYPDLAKYSLAVAESCRDLGITHRRMRKNKEAIAYYDEAVEILEPVIEQHPDDHSARRTLGSITNSIGFFYANVNSELDLDRALELYRLSEEQYQYLSSVDPLIIEYQDGLGRAASNIGSIYQQQNKLNEALAARQKSMNIRSRISAANPIPYLKSNLAISTNGVGATLRDLGRLEESIEHHLQAHQFHLAAVTADPLQPRFKSRLTDGLVQIARAYSSAGQYSDAVENIDSIDEFIEPDDTHTV